MASTIHRKSSTIAFDDINDVVHAAKNLLALSSSSSKTNIKNNNNNQFNNFNKEADNNFKNNNNFNNLFNNKQEEEDNYEGTTPPRRMMNFERNNVSKNNHQNHTTTTATAAAANGIASKEEATHYSPFRLPERISSASNHNNTLTNEIENMDPLLSLPSSSSSYSAASSSKCSGGGVSKSNLTQLLPSTTTTTNIASANGSSSSSSSSHSKSDEIASLITQLLDHHKLVATNNNNRPSSSSSSRHQQSSTYSQQMSSSSSSSSNSIANMKEKEEGRSPLQKDVTTTMLSPKNSRSSISILRSPPPPSSFKSNSLNNGSTDVDDCFSTTTTTTTSSSSDIMGRVVPQQSPLSTTTSSSSSSSASSPSSASDSSSLTTTTTILLNEQQQQREKSHHNVRFALVSSDGAVVGLPDDSLIANAVLEIDRRGGLQGGGSSIAAVSERVSVLMNQHIVDLIYENVLRRLQLQSLVSFREKRLSHRSKIESALITGPAPQLLPWNSTSEFGKAEQACIDEVQFLLVESFLKPVVVSAEKSAASSLRDLSQEIDATRTLSWLETDGGIDINSFISQELRISAEKRARTDRQRRGSSTNNRTRTSKADPFDCSPANVLETALPLLYVHILEEVIEFISMSSSSSVEEEQNTTTTPAADDYNNDTTSICSSVDSNGSLLSTTTTNTLLLLNNNGNNNNNKNKSEEVEEKERIEITQIALQKMNELFGYNLCMPQLQRAASSSIRSRLRRANEFKMLTARNTQLQLLVTQNDKLQEERKLLQKERAEAALQLERMRSSVSRKISRHEQREQTLTLERDSLLSEKQKLIESAETAVQNCSQKENNFEEAQQSFQMQKSALQAQLETKYEELSTLSTQNALLKETVADFAHKCLSSDRAVLQNAFKIVSLTESMARALISEEESDSLLDLYLLFIKKFTGDDCCFSSGFVRWVPDELQLTCKICNRHFGICLRHHHCRKCGNNVCWRCSNHFEKISSQLPIAVRVCSRCIHDNTTKEEEEEVVGLTSSSSGVKIGRFLIINKDGTVSRDDDEEEMKEEGKKSC